MKIGVIMASNLFNYESQRLSAEGLRQLNSFNSYNFAGIIGNKSPIEIENTDFILRASETEPVFMLGGGLLISQTSNISWTLSQDNMMGYIRVTLNPETGTIVTDEYSGIEIPTDPHLCSYVSMNKEYTIYSVIDTLNDDDNPSILHYYEYSDGTYTESTDTVIDETKTYYMKYDSSSFSFRISEADPVYNYNGNTIWVSDNSFIIPICVRINGEIKTVVRIKDLRDLEGFLSLESYAKLKAYCEGTFVWTVGGDEEVTAPDGTVHRKGDIGNLNVTGGVISNNVDNEPVILESLQIQDFQNASEDDRLYVDNFGNVQLARDYRVPVDRGGTFVDGSWDETKPRYSAKRNLGIYYGTNSPSDKYPVPNPVEGDIYLKIIDD